MNAVQVRSGGDFLLTLQNRVNETEDKLEITSLYGRFRGRPARLLTVGSTELIN